MEETGNTHDSRERDRELVAAARRKAEEFVKLVESAMPPSDWVPGYRIMRRLGQGGMGIVYAAEKLDTHQTVALKTILGGGYADERRRMLFHGEREALARLSHPYIASILAAPISRDGEPCFAMELVDGVPLNQYIREKKLDVRARPKLFCDICDAVSHAHQKAVVHRDLKPSNILIDARGNPRVLDFGLAKITESDVGLPGMAEYYGRVRGTLPYMSPEQVGGKVNEIDVRSDVYSLGVVLYEMLTERVPFETAQTTTTEITRTICDQPPPRPSSINRSLRGDLETIVLKALEKDPLRRYQTVAALADDVDRYLTDQPILARPQTAAYLLRKLVKRNKVPVGLILSTLVTALVLALVGVPAMRGHIERIEQRSRARQHVLQTQHKLDKSVVRGSVSGSVADAGRVLGENLALPEAWLVYAQARFHLAEAKDQSWAIESAINSLTEAMDNYFPAEPGFCALLKEICDETKHAQCKKIRIPDRIEPPERAEELYIRSFATLDMQQAKDYARAALVHDANHALAGERFAYLCLVTKEYDQALWAAQILTDHADDTADRLKWLLFQGHVLIVAGDYAEAIERFDAASDLVPSSPDPYRYRALASLCQGEYEDAIEAYTKDLEVHATPKMCTRWEHNFLATPLWITGQRKRAADQYELFCEQRGTLAVYGSVRWILVLRDQARELESQGLTGEAGKLRQKAEDMLDQALLEVDQETWLGKIFRCLGRDVTPEELVKHAAQDDREQVCEGYYYAGEVCLLNGEVKQARDFFEQCVNTGLLLDSDEWPPDPMNEYHLALWRLKLLRRTDGAMQGAFRRMRHSSWCIKYVVRHYLVPDVFAGGRSDYVRRSGFRDSQKGSDGSLKVL